MNPPTRALRIWPALLACLTLTACSSRPPTPDWQANAHAASERGVQAFLSGNDRVAAQEFRRAREETARTGRAALMARVVLLECAAWVASLDLRPCEPFAALRGDAGTEERAYADYLAGRLLPADIPLLPPSQQPAAAAPAASAAAVLARIGDPLSRLVAAGVLVQDGRADPSVAVIAADTASAQGWRRPLLAWLLVQARMAEERGLSDEAARLRRRILLVEQGGAVPGSHARPGFNSR